jgi:hypothetical protein
MGKISDLPVQVACTPDAPSRVLRKISAAKKGWLDRDYRDPVGV